MYFKAFCCVSGNGRQRFYSPIRGQEPKQVQTERFEIGWEYK